MYESTTLRFWVAFRKIHGWLRFSLRYSLMTKRVTAMRHRNSCPQLRFLFRWNCRPPFQRISWTSKGNRHERKNQFLADLQRLP